jgi:beta-glucosidase
MMEETMRTKRFKRSAAALATAAVAFTLAGTLTFQPIASVASADSTSSTLKAYEYESQYDSYDDVLQAGSDLNLELAAEGFVLLKNDNNALPLAKSERNVTVLGTAAGNLATGGGGTGGQSRPGGGTSDVATETASQVYDALDAAGINYNTRLKTIYDGVEQLTNTTSGDSGFTSSNPRESATYMTKVEKNTEGAVEFAGNYYVTNPNSTVAPATSTLGSYSDAAIVVISRTGSEGSDNPSNNVGGHTDKSEHYLQLDDAEKEMFAYAKQNFSKIIVIVNSPSVVELGDIQDDDAFEAVLWVGQPGWNGILALGDILTGAINPSGKTVDYYMRSLKEDPSWYNFGDYSQYNYIDEIKNGKFDLTRLESGYTYKMAFDAGNTTQINTHENAIDYAEGIYNGYRYYETVYAELGGAGNKTAEEWYTNHTVYPFGYGLSYTSFTQTIDKIDGDISKADGNLTVYVTVKNTGTYSGKDVVELYSTPNYTEGGIDKADVNLVGFTKTKELKPGASQTVAIEIAVKDLASFDYNDANGNGFFGYELENGKYTLSVRSDSHTVLDSKTLTLSASTTVDGVKLDGLGWDEDGDASTPNNIYSITSEDTANSQWARYNTLADTWISGNTQTETSTNHYLTRAKLVEDGEVFDLTDLAWMAALDGSQSRRFSEVALNILNNRTDNGNDGNMYKDYDNVMTANVVEEDYQNLWTKSASDIPSTWTQESTSTAYTLYDMKGLDYDDAKWTDYLNQFTYADLVETFQEGNYGNQAVESVGKPQISDLDGPGQLSGGWAWVCEVVIASTWNTDLAYQEGVIVGNESMWQGVNGWYGPAMDIHRNPLAGRNFEYYSQDGVQGGLIGAAVVSGAVSQGCHVYIKHSFLNDQETNRISTITFVTEQAIREIYAKPFEISVKKGGANGIMTSFTLTGLEPSTSYATSIQLYTNEWGYYGFSVTDAHVTDDNQTGWNSFNMIRGLTMPLGSLTTTGLGTWKTVNGVTGVYVRGQKNSKASDDISYTQWYYTRELAHRILYNNANGSGILNGGSSNGYASTLLSEAVGTSTNVALSVGDTYTKDLNSADLKQVFGSTGYTITATNLPDGVTLKDGVLSGTPTQSGTYKTTLNLAGNYGFGYIKASATVTFTVSTDKLTVSNTSTTYGTEVSATVGQTFVTLTTGENGNFNADAEESADYVGIYKSISYEAEGLPYGLSLTNNPVVPGATVTATATISGTPKATGTYQATIKVVLEQIQSKAMTMEEMMASMGGGMPGGGGGDSNGDGGKSGSSHYTPDADLADDATTGSSNRPAGGGDMMGGPNMSMTSYSTGTVVYSAVVTITVADPADKTITNVEFKDGNTTLGKIGYENTTDTLTADDLKAFIPTSTNGSTFLGWATTANATEPNVVAGTTTVANATTTSQSQGQQPGQSAETVTTTAVYAVWAEPEIQIKNGVWYINGVSTGISATGTAGTNGTDGTDGTDGSDGVGILSVDLVSSTDDDSTYRFIFTDGSTYEFTLKNGATGKTGADGTSVKGDAGKDGVDGKDGSSVAGIVLGVVALVVALGAAGVVVFVLLKKKQ